MQPLTLRRKTKLKVDMALNSANTTLRQTPSENGSESEAGAKTSERQSLKEKRVHTEVYEHDVEHTAISCECVLKLLGDVTKARYALRGFEEDVKDGDVFASTTLTASVRLPFAMAVDQRSEQHTAFTAHATRPSSTQAWRIVTLCTPCLRLSGAQRLWTAPWERPCGSWSKASSDSAEGLAGTPGEHLDERWRCVKSVQRKSTCAARC